MEEEVKEEVEEPKEEEMTEELVAKEAAAMPEPAPTIQNQEHISMRKNAKLEDMSNEELTDLLAGVDWLAIEVRNCSNIQADLAHESMRKCNLVECFTARR